VKFSGAGSKLPSSWMAELRNPEGRAVKQNIEQAGL
jgi:hypothetical protein